ncbi:hypothetical protein SSP24_40090 [Streptomyces spinoverrucosus]|uniref:DUF4232 domain-containing protein n=1 Tax=Streptomyces spinoverrucosus TaxID=284043 RepID=A0A4Y3VHF2_9ACTN|nr:hypothetical protein [Streptomyces spinoverrucosus]GEC06354.1 hypothetical protein SSP24_40090 [Streptomyces spinoverrucosus]GHB76389.1 hypothetical protein GCM10010397_53660 [Streptomyces spinoverrucosus]
MTNGKSHEPYEWREPIEAHDQEPKQPQAGNETVNDRLDDQSSEGLDSDELALRRMLHQAVQDIEPRDGTLDHLRRAVPARRARKRQAAVGMAAAALFVCTAVPALVHVSNSTGPDANPTIAGHGAQAQGGASEGLRTDGTGATSGGSTGTGENQGKASPTPNESPGSTPSSGVVDDTTDDVYPSATSAVAAPVCTAAQLGSATATADVPDSAGTVYGTFRITNVSTAGCTVGGAGAVTPLAQGAADATKISVVAHTAGDEATGLPDPAKEVPQLVLEPGAAYEVRFAWMPSETCPTDNSGDTGGGTADPSPDASPSTDAGTTTEGSSTGGDTGTSTQLMTEEGTKDGSVVVSYTAEAGAPTVSATVSNACAGTVYRTGVLSAS